MNILGLISQLIGIKTLRLTDLIDENRNWWNETIIDEVFDPSTARVIKRMPLRSLSSHDVVTWSEAPFGTYSVSTAYL